MLECSSENGWIMDTHLINYFCHFFPQTILSYFDPNACIFSVMLLLKTVIYIDSNTGITVQVQQNNLRDYVWTGVQIFIFSRLSKQFGQLSYFSDFYIMPCKREQLTACLSHSCFPFQWPVEWWSQFAYRILNPHAEKEIEPAATQAEQRSPRIMLCTAMAKR